MELQPQALGILRYFVSDLGLLRSSEMFEAVQAILSGLCTIWSTVLNWVTKHSVITTKIASWPTQTFAQDSLQSGHCFFNGLSPRCCASVLYNDCFLLVSSSSRLLSPYTLA